MNTKLLVSVIASGALMAAFVITANAKNSAPISQIHRPSIVPAAPAAPEGNFGRVTYQGRLTDSAGASINSAVNVVFKIYDDASTLMWMSTIRSITPVNGLFTVYLGDGTDPDLTATVLKNAASLGVTVNGDAEMSPRQSFNTLVGHSNTGSAIYGSTSATGGTFAGVRGVALTTTSAGVYAENAVITGTALNIQQGVFRVAGAGVGTDTTVFIHKVKTGAGGNICPGFNTYTVVDNPLINGNPNAILLVTPNYGNASNGVLVANGGFAVFYADNLICGAANVGHWVIFSLGAALNNNALVNVMVVIP